MSPFLHFHYRTGCINGCISGRINGGFSRRFNGSFNNGSVSNNRHKGTLGVNKKTHLKNQTPRQGSSSSPPTTLSSPPTSHTILITTLPGLNKLLPSSLPPNLRSHSLKLKAAVVNGFSGTLIEKVRCTDIVKIHATCTFADRVWLKAVGCKVGRGYKVRGFRDVEDLGRAIERGKEIIQRYGIGIGGDRGREVIVQGGNCLDSSNFERSTVVHTVRTILGYPSSQPTYVNHQPSSPNVQDGILIREDGVWVDCTGKKMGERGYRGSGGDGKAPIRDEVVEGGLRWSGFNDEGKGGKEVIVVDPFCGSGTIGINADMILRPGSISGYTLGRSSRSFNFLRFDKEEEGKVGGFGKGGEWPSVKGGVVNNIKLEEEEGMRGRVRVYGMDRDEGVIERAKANAERAGVKGAVWKCQSISELKNEWGDEKGWIITNPPWGERIKGGRKGEGVRNLWGKFGNILKKEFQGWNVVVFSNDKRRIREMGLGKGWKSMQVEYGGGKKGIWHKVVGA